jgi:hypothetical protein
MYPMNRCVERYRNTLFSLSGAALVAAACLLAVPAHAQDQSIQTQNEAALGGRNFPVGTLRGQIAFLAPPMIQLDGGQAERLAPGAKIQGPQRMLVMPAALAGQRFVVNYTKDSAGMVRDVWLLTPEEASAERVGAAKPFFNFWPFAAASTGPRDDGNTPFDQLPRYGQ